KTNYEVFLSAIQRGLSQKELILRFYWLTHDYLGQYVDAAYLRALDRKKIDEELHQAKERIKAIKRLHRALPSHLRKQLHIIQETLYLYNERKKAVLNKVNIFLRAIVEHKLNNPSRPVLHALYQCSPQEILDLLAGRPVPEQALRNQAYVYHMQNGKITKGNAKHLAMVKALQQTQTLTGKTAYPGKVKAKVSIVLNLSQFYSFQEGNILVAPFTTVSYLPLMRKASGFITETGGLTSHAAIVSRELKKPCMVGVANATKALKQDEEIVLDATKGKIYRLG
ncbi:MAG: PEP-utilizing enzyme, partial [Candidatus Woesearchaeota archaeon]